MIKLFVEYNALRWFFKNQPLSPGPFEQPSFRYLLWREFHKLLTENVALYINIDHGEMIELLENQDPIIRFFFDCFQQNNIKFNNCEELKEEQPESISSKLFGFSNLFFLAKGKKDVDEFMNKTGIMAMGTDDSFWDNFQLLSQTRLEKKNLKRIHVNQYSAFKWTDLKEVSHRFTCLILIDRYILKNKNGLEENLVPLLKNLLAENNGAEYRIDVSILYEIGEKTPKKEDIKKQVSSLPGFTNLHVHVIPYNHVVEEDDISHDRIVFTNYFALRSGDSFNYFSNNKIQKNTTLLEIGPVTDPQIFSLVMQRYNEIREKIPADAQ